MAELALVTGASSGIGKAFVERLVNDGFSVIAVGRNQTNLYELVASLPQGNVETLSADLATDDGVNQVAKVCADRPITLLVNNAGVAHYMPFAELPADKAREILGVKVIAPTMLARAVVPGMIERGGGSIINVAGMIAFSGPAIEASKPTRAVYGGTLAHLVTLTQILHAELADQGIRVEVLCPGIVATEFHTRQGMDLSALPRMQAADVVSAGLKGLELGEVVCAPGVEDASLLANVFDAERLAFGGQSPTLASRYR